MPIVNFNETQKAAIVSLLIEMINADHEVDPSECAVFDTICVEYNICEETYNVGRALTGIVAVNWGVNTYSMNQFDTFSIPTVGVNCDTKPNRLLPGNTTIATNMEKYSMAVSTALM